MLCAISSWLYVSLVRHKAAQSLSCWCKHAVQSYLGFIQVLGLLERSFRPDLPAHTNTHTTHLSLSITYSNAQTKIDHRKRTITMPFPAPFLNSSYFSPLRCDALGTAGTDEMGTRHLIAGRAGLLFRSPKRRHANGGRFQHLKGTLCSLLIEEAAK